MPSCQFRNGPERQNHSTSSSLVMLELRRAEHAAKHTQKNTHGDEASSATHSGWSRTRRRKCFRAALESQHVCRQRCPAHLLDPRSFSPSICNKNSGEHEHISKSALCSRGCSNRALLAAHSRSTCEILRRLSSMPCRSLHVSAARAPHSCTVWQVRHQGQQQQQLQLQRRRRAWVPLVLVLARWLLRHRLLLWRCPSWPMVPRRG